MNAINITESIKFAISNPSQEPFTINPNPQLSEKYTIKGNPTK
jgi:hypothetical protein